MSTIREWLNEVEFDWEHGKIVFQDSHGYSPGWSSGRELDAPIYISNQHPILDKEFDSGYGSPQCPRFIAKDGKFLYFPDQYDGATSIVRVAHNLSYYVRGKNATPYPGGAISGWINSSNH